MKKLSTKYRNKLSKNKGKDRCRTYFYIQPQFLNNIGTRISTKTEDKHHSIRGRRMKIFALQKELTRANYVLSLGRMVINMGAMIIPMLILF